MLRVSLHRAVRRRMQLFGAFGILVAMPLVSARTEQEKDASELARLPGVQAALHWLEQNAGWVTEQQVRITEIPAPEFSERARGEFVGKLLESCGLVVHTDDAGNVIGERAGVGADPHTQDVLLIAAHLDTVFPAGTDLRVRRKEGRLEAPGISDNGAGLATLVGVARALNEAGLRTRMTLLFAADVGEEGEGNLRGMRRLVETYRDRLRGVIAIDGFSTDHITTTALPSRRVEVSITGPGGHSWSDFGIPNPITALARAIVHFSAVRVSAAPRTTFNVGVIEGGTSVNSIPARAAVRVDIRSEDPTDIARVNAALESAVQAGMKEEMAAARGGEKLEAHYRALGERPGGSLPEDAALLAAIRSADRYLNHRSRLEQASTDANIPLSLSIPAIAIGGGGDGGGAHSLAEWYDPRGRELGLKRVLLTTLTMAGVQP